MSTFDTRAPRAFAIARQCEPLLKGQPPEIQGGALAELVSIWLAGHHPDIREQVLQFWIETVRELTVDNTHLRGLWSRDGVSSTSAAKPKP